VQQKCDKRTVPLEGESGTEWTGGSVGEEETKEARQARRKAA